MVHSVDLYIPRMRQMSFGAVGANGKSHGKDPRLGWEKLFRTFKFFMKFLKFSEFLICS